ncbi:GtrA family protein [Agromyces mediolanus]|uniref:GtrA family protein n=1 Tax=Agromyces mediolanus TaxID=41986 RepID=UPI003837556C
MELRSRLRRLAALGSRFLVVGAVSTLIEVGVFNLLVFVWGWDVVWAKILASLVALVNAYIGNREWTFRHRDRRGRVNELVLFVLANLACTALGALIVWAGVGAVGVVLGREPGPVAVNVVNLASIAIVVLVRFVLYHRIVFRAAPASSAAAAAAAGAVPAVPATDAAAEPEVERGEPGEDSEERP